MQDLESMIGYNEQILWRGKPNKKCFILESIFNAMLPFALLWGCIDGFVISAALSTGISNIDGAGSAGMPILAFFAIHLMPVWLYLGGVFSSISRYKRTAYIITDQAIYLSGGKGSNRTQRKPFSDMVNVEIRKGFFDEKLKVADIICFCPSSCGTVTHYVNRRPVTNDMNICDISDYTEVYSMISRLKQDAERNRFQNGTMPFQNGPVPYPQNVQYRTPNPGYPQTPEFGTPNPFPQTPEFGNPNPFPQSPQFGNPNPFSSHDPSFTNPASPLPQDVTFGSPNQSFTSDSSFDSQFGDPKEWDADHAEKNPWD